MQSRPDRIDFPPVDPDELWKDVSPSQVIAPLVDLQSSHDSQKDSPKGTPIIATPHANSPVFGEGSGDNFFKARQLAGLITPARTPSDILYRGPLYASSSEEDCCEGSRLTSPGSSPRETNTELHNRLQYHRERQAAIKQTLSDFNSKMSNLIEWHKHQEQAISSQLNTLPRGRSKLCERLYEAIEFNSG